MRIANRRRAQLLVAAALGLVPRAAGAFHTPEVRSTEDTAYTLRKSTVRLGIWKEQYALYDSLLVGTYFWPWLAKVPNAQIKWRLYQSDPWAVAVGLGGYFLDTVNFKNIDENTTRAKLAVVPFEVLGSYRLDDAFTLSAGFVHTTVKADGYLRSGSFYGAANGAVQNLQYTATFEWRATPVTALTLHVRYLVFQRLRASADATSHPDPYTTVEIHGGALSNRIDYGGAFSITPSVLLSWQHFNLSAGLGYGNYSVPGVNFVLEKKSLIAALDLFWLL